MRYITNSLTVFIMVAIVLFIVGIVIAAYGIHLSWQAFVLGIVFTIIVNSFRYNGQGILS